MRLSYSNAPLLEKLEIHYVEEFEGDVPPADANTKPVPARASAPRARATWSCASRSRRKAPG